MTTELSGNILALVTLSHWYENVFLLGVVGLFIINSSWVSIPVSHSGLPCGFSAGNAD